MPDYNAPQLANEPKSNHMKAENQRRILIIDDCQIHRDIILRLVGEMGHHVELADGGRDGIKKAISQVPDLILCDIEMPEISGIEVCEKLKKHYQTKSIPVIFISSSDRPVDRVRGLKAGAIDYIVKPFDDAELSARINVVIELVANQEMLFDRAYRDELTGLTNRRRFIETLQRELELSQQRCQPLSLIILDIDHFKGFNDKYGHLGGDKVLRDLGNILSKNFQRTDLVARYGGEEFVILLPYTCINDAAAAGERLRKVIESHLWNLSSEPVKVTISLGVDGIEGDGNTQSESLIKRADAALYEAKAQGRNRLVRWDEIDIVKSAVHINYQEYQHFENVISDISLDIRQQSSQTIHELTFQTLRSIDAVAAHGLKNAVKYVLGASQIFDLSLEFKERLVLASKLYKLGKVSVPENLFNANARLSPAERQIVKQYPLLSVKLLSNMGIFDNVLPIIRHLGERFDGSGFPEGLSAKKIPFGSRVLAVCEMFSTFVCNENLTPSENYDVALNVLRQNSGSAFDPEVVSAFINLAREDKGHWLKGWQMPGKTHIECVSVS